MERYVRQISLTEIGEEGQKRLSKARVLLVGAGGLGSPAAIYLAAAGVGHIGLMDDDTVDVGNLQRQILYAESELGRYKAEAAAERLMSMNSCISAEPLVCRLTEDNAEEVISRYDIIVDGCDNFETRCLMDKTCRRLGKPYVYGAIQGFEGQVSVFSHGTLGYVDLFGCTSGKASQAVTGMTAGIIGSVMAHEVLKIICGYGEVLAGRMWTIDLLTMQSNLIEL